MSAAEHIQAIAKLSYTHEAMVDYIIAHPSVRQADLAVIFDRTPAWVSRILNTDAFRAALAKRKAAFVDPILASSVEDRFSHVAAISLDIIARRLEAINQFPVPMEAHEEFALKSADLATKAMGYGAKSQATQTNVAVVVQVPAKIPSAQDWVSAHAPE
jgi:hypothetical protein